CIYYAFTSVIVLSVICPSCSSFCFLYIFSFFFFFFNDPPTPELYTLSLHDALPIYRPSAYPEYPRQPAGPARRLPDERRPGRGQDRKSTRLNSSHVKISYAVFCLKKKKKENRTKTVKKLQRTTKETINRDMTQAHTQ